MHILGRLKIGYTNMVENEASGFSFVLPVSSSSLSHSFNVFFFVFVFMDLKEFLGDTSRDW